MSSQAKYIVNSVHEFFEKEKAKQKATLRDQVVKRTAAACGIGVTTVIRLHKEYGDSGGILSSPKKRYDETRVQLVLNEVDVEGIRKEVHEFYQRKEYPTLSSLMEKFKGNNSFNSLTTTAPYGAKLQFPKRPLCHMAHFTPAWIYFTRTGFILTSSSQDNRYGLIYDYYNYLYMTIKGQ